MWEESSGREKVTFKVALSSNDNCKDQNISFIFGYGIVNISYAKIIA